MRFCMMDRKEMKRMSRKNARRDDILWFVTCMIKSFWRCGIIINSQGQAIYYFGNWWMPNVPCIAPGTASQLNLCFTKVTFSEIGCIFWRGSPQETSQKSITLVLWLEQSIHVKRVDNWILLLCITLRLCILSAMNATQKKSGAHFVANYVYHRLCHIRGMINWPKVHQFRKLFACVLYIIGLSYLKKKRKRFHGSLLCQVSNLLKHTKYLKINTYLCISVDHFFTQIQIRPRVTVFSH